MTLELHSFKWEIASLKIERVESSFFEDAKLFPPGSVTFDNALLMRQIEHEWHGKATLCACKGTQGQESLGFSPSARTA